MNFAVLKGEAYRNHEFYTESDEAKLKKGYEFSVIEVLVKEKEAGKVSKDEINKMIAEAMKNFASQFLG